VLPTSGSVANLPNEWLVVQHCLVRHDATHYVFKWDGVKCWLSTTVEVKAIVGHKLRIAERPLYFVWCLVIGGVYQSLEFTIQVFVKCKHLSGIHNGFLFSGFELDHCPVITAAFVLSVLRPASDLLTTRQLRLTPNVNELLLMPSACLYLINGLEYAGLDSASCFIWLLRLSLSVEGQELVGGRLLFFTVEPKVWHLPPEVSWSQGQRYRMSGEFPPNVVQRAVEKKHFAYAVRRALGELVATMLEGRFGGTLCPNLQSPLSRLAVVSHLVATVLSGIMQLRVQLACCTVDCVVSTVDDGVKVLNDHGPRKAIQIKILLQIPGQVTRIVTPCMVGEHQFNERHEHLHVGEYSTRVPAALDDWFLPTMLWQASQNGKRPMYPN